MARLARTQRKSEYWRRGSDGQDRETGWKGKCCLCTATHGHSRSNFALKSWTTCRRLAWRGCSRVQRDKRGLWEEVLSVPCGKTSLLCSATSKKNKTNSPRQNIDRGPREQVPVESLTLHVINFARRWQNVLKHCSEWGRNRIELAWSSSCSGSDSKQVWCNLPGNKLWVSCQSPLDVTFSHCSTR